MVGLEGDAPAGQVDGPHLDAVPHGQRGGELLQERAQALPAEDDAVPFRRPGEIDGGDLLQILGAGEGAGDEVGAGAEGAEIRQNLGGRQVAAGIARRDDGPLGSAHGADEIFILSVARLLALQIEAGGGRAVIKVEAGRPAERRKGSRAGPVEPAGAHVEGPAEQLGVGAGAPAHPVGGFQ